MKNDLEKYFDFIGLVEGLKKIERFKDQFFWKNYPKLDRYESVADHSWRLALFVLLFQDKIRNFDVNKAVKIALIHDLPEIVAGDAHPMGKDGTGKDTYFSNKIKAKERFKKEQRAAKKILSKLPQKQSKELYKLWLEYENQKTKEAKIVKALDKIECIMQVNEYRHGNLFPKHQKFNLKYISKYADTDLEIKKFTQILVNKLNKNFKEYRK